MNRRSTVVLTLALILLPLFAAHAKFYSVKEFGAQGDGESLDTPAIQKAIDTATAGGGGTVYFPAGTYLSGTIVLKNHVSLYLDAGAAILGSTDINDYPVKIPQLRSYTDNYTIRSLIYAEQATNISILGRGTINGQGAAFKDRRSQDDPYKQRPYMIRMIECRDVTVRDVTIINSPMWVQHYLACEDVIIDGITVDSYVAGNNDGIDIDSCNKVRISNCNIWSGDDAIVLKATTPKKCQNVTVTNCVLSTRCNAFKLGTESTGGFENIVFSNSTIHDTRLAAIALEEVDGGTLERISISNITMKNVGTAIFMRLGNRGRPYLAKGPGGSRGTWVREPDLEIPGVGKFSQVVISNVQAVEVDSIGCSITGIPEHPVENITLENISIQFKGGGTADMVTREIPENEENYPEYKMFGPLPSYGFFVRHAQDVNFENVKVGFAKADHRPAFVFDDVEGLALKNVDGSLLESAPALMMFDNVKEAFVTECRPKQNLPVFLRARNSSSIFISGNDFAKVNQKVIIGDGMSNADVFKINNRE